MRQRRLARPRIEHRHEFLVAAHRANRKPAANDFCERGQIRVDIEQPLRAAMAEPKRDHFVGVGNSATSRNETVSSLSWKWG